MLNTPGAPWSAAVEATPPQAYPMRSMVRAMTAFDSGILGSDRLSRGWLRRKRI